MPLGAARSRLALRLGGADGVVRAVRRSRDDNRRTGQVAVMSVTALLLLALVLVALFQWWQRSG